MESTPLPQVGTKVRVTLPTSRSTITRQVTIKRHNADGTAYGVYKIHGIEMGADFTADELGAAR